MPFDKFHRIIPAPLLRQQSGGCGEHSRRHFLLRQRHVPPAADGGAAQPAGPSQAGRGDRLPAVVPQLVRLRVQFPACGQTGEGRFVRVFIIKNENPILGLLQTDCRDSSHLQGTKTSLPRSGDEKTLSLIPIIFSEVHMVHPFLFIPRLFQN